MQLWEESTCTSHIHRLLCSRCETKAAFLSSVCLMKPLHPRHRNSGSRRVCCTASFQGRSLRLPAAVVWRSWAALALARDTHHQVDPRQNRPPPQEGAFPHNCHMDGHRKDTFLKALHQSRDSRSIETSAIQKSGRRQRGKVIILVERAI